MSEPKQHATRRRLLAPGFSNSTVLVYEATVRDLIGQAVKKIKRDAQAGNADILKWFKFMALDVSGELMFGRSFEILQQETVSTPAGFRYCIRADIQLRNLPTSTISKRQ